MADGLTSLLPIKWGQSTGGAPGEAESTLTLGVNRQDVRTPPDTYHVWHAQSAAIENVVLAMTADFKGGTRVRLREQSTNPFAANESGIYVDTSGNAYVVHNGIPTLLQPSGPASTVANAAIDAFTVIKASTVAGRFVMLGTADPAYVAVGVALTSAAGAASVFNALFVSGVATSIKSDGTTVIAAGDIVEPSPTVAGRIRKGTIFPLGSAISAAAATLDALVTVL